MRKHIWFLVTLLFISGFALGQQHRKPASSKKMTPQEVHRSALIIDTHADTTQRLLDEQFDLAHPPPGDDGQIDLAKAKAGNLGAEFFSIWVEPKEWKGQYARRTLELIDSVYQQADKHPDQMQMAFSTDDILRTHKAGKFAALMGIEGGHSIENSIPLLRDYYRLGVRYMTLTWSNTNEWADSSGDVTDTTITHHNGLTQHGRDIVREMNRLGMMVDISHVADKTFWAVLTTTRAPIIASHSSARALTNQPRNMTDEMLVALGRNGGVCMVNFFSAFIDDDFRKQYDATKEQRDKEQAAVEEKYKDADPKTRAEALNEVNRRFAKSIPRPPLKSLIDHIDHVAKVAGIDHVGLGSDFDGISYLLPQGIDSAADLPKITEELMKRGYTAEQMHKILGGNLMRVFREVEAMKKQIAAEGEQAPLLHRKGAQ